MTTPPQPGPRFGTDSQFVPDYQVPAWYHAHQAPRSTNAESPPAAPAFAPAPPIGCRVCRVTPVAPVTIRAHQGLIFVMRWHKIDGPLCAICGIALVREMTSKTLCQGWWGVGSLIVGAPYALMSNWAAYRKLRRLQPAVPIAGMRQPPLGKPVLHRPLSYVVLIPILGAACLIVSALTR